MFDSYKVTLTLLRDQLGTNPLDPNVLDKHIIQRQRKIIMEKSKVNSEVNKYLDAVDISKERGEKEIEAIADKLQAISGLVITDEHKKAIAAGKLEALKESFLNVEVTGVTVFFNDKETGLPCIGDHMIYGFLKASAEAICRAKITNSEEKKASRGKVLGSAAYTQSLINQHVRCSEEMIPFDKGVKLDENGNIWFLQRSLRAMTAQGPRISLAKSEVVEAGAKLTFTLNVMKGSPITEEALNQMFSYGQITGLGQWRNSGKGQFKHTLEKI